ncbi:pH-sensitive chloride channel 1 isoform X6 [Osmia lignaria lignaria]|uniref:pH-sensitive chloride channel 1 isoform X6 n=1 Tax=Osmia lignaria lignaria TaxID=1437193 RepID=UPI00402BF0DB
MGWVALGRCAGGGGRLSSVLSLSLTSLASSLIFTILCILTLALTLVTLVRAEDIFEEGKSDKEILDNLLLSTRYDKRLLPPVQDADFCCGMRWPGDATGLSNRSSTSSNDPKNQYKNQNNNHYTSHRHLRTHLRGTLTVNVSVLLLSLASPDESSLKYEVEFLLQQQWYDPRLRYSNRSQYEFLNAIHHYDDIWLPDTYFIMHGDFKDPLIPVHFALRIYRNGTVNYLMRRHLILSCQGRLNIFPFDDPLCSFAIESISYEQTAITYVWKNDEGTLRKSPSLTSLNAYLIKNQTITCPIKVSWRADGQIMVDYEDEFDEFGDSKCSLCQRRFEEQGNYSCLKVDLIFTRDRAFYFTTVFIPGIILVTSSFITFWLEWNAVPARVMIEARGWSTNRSYDRTERDRHLYQLWTQPLHPHHHQRMHRRVEKKGTTASDKSSKDDRRDSENYLSGRLFHVPHLFLHPLQRQLVDRNRQTIPSVLCAITWFPNSKVGIRNIQGIKEIFIVRLEKELNR